MHQRISLLPVLALCAFAACSRGDENVITLTGIMDANTVRISAQTPGLVTHRGFDEGTAVDSGRTLAVVETEKLGYQVAQSAAAMDELDRQREAAQRRLDAAGIERENVRVRYDRFRSLLEGRATTQQSVDDLKARLDAADEELRAARAQIAAFDSKRQQIDQGRRTLERQVRDATIVAPLAGTVIVRYTDVGELLGVGSPVCDIADLGTMWTKVYLEEPMLPRVRLGQPARISVDGAADTLAGTVTWISDKAEFTPKAILTEETRTALVYAAKVTVANPRGVLKIGMPVTVRLNAAAR